MNYVKPLTPALRRQIDKGIERQMMELSECQYPSYVFALRTGLKATKTLIRGLPDGFPIPVEPEDTKSKMPSSIVSFDEIRRHE